MEWFRFNFIQLDLSCLSECSSLVLPQHMRPDLAFITAMDSSMTQRKLFYLV